MTNQINAEVKTMLLSNPMMVALAKIVRTYDNVQGGYEQSDEEFYDDAANDVGNVAMPMQVQKKC